jgi:hypothetical protein
MTQLARPAAPSLIERLAIGISVAAAAIAVTVTLVDVVVAQSLLVGTGIALAIVAGRWCGSARSLPREVFRRGRTWNRSNLRQSPIRRLNLTTLITLLGGAALFVRLGPSLVPRTTWTDFSAHGGLVTWIAENRRLPNPSLWPVGMSNYPKGSHITAAVLAELTRLRPLETLWLVALLSIFVQWPLLTFLTRMMFPNDMRAARITRWAGLGTLVVWMLAYQHSAGLVTLDFYFAQTVGQWWALAGVAIAVRGLAGHQPLRRWLPEALVMVVGSMLAYPQGSVSVLGASVLGLVAADLSRRTRLMLLVGGVGAALVGLFVLTQSPYWNRAAFAGLPSNAPLITPRTLGGHLTVAFAGVGLIILFSQSRRHRAVLPVVGAIAAPLLVIGAMFAMRSGIPIRIDFTNYRVLKNVFGLIPYGVLVAGVGIAWTVEWLSSAVPRLRSYVPLAAQVVAGIVLVGLIWSLHRPQNSLRPNYSRDAYLLGLSLPASIRNGDLGVVGPGFGAYTLRWSGIGDLSAPNEAMDIPRSVRYERWPDASVAQNHLLVSGPWRDRFLSRPGVEVVQRRGEAVLLRRRALTAGPLGQ